MTIDVQQVRGATTNSPTSPTSAAFVGPLGQIIVDTDGFGHGGPLIRVQDGSTAGGWPIFGSPVTPSGVDVILSAVTGTSFTLSTLTALNTLFAVVSATGGNKTLAIPSASAFGGYILIIKMKPAVTGLLTVTPATGTIDLAANAQFTSPGSITLVADAVNNDWIVT